MESKTVMLRYLIRLGTIITGLLIFYPANWRIKASKDISGNMFHPLWDKLSLFQGRLLERKLQMQHCTSVLLYLRKHLCGQSGQNSSVLHRRCLGWFCFICACVCFNEGLKPLHLVIYFPPLESMCPGCAASPAVLATTKGGHCLCHAAATRAGASPSG